VSVTYVVDTGILVDHLRDEPAATKCLEGALRSGRRVAGSVLTRVELRRGAQPHELVAIEGVERLLDWVAVDHEIAALAEQHAERFGSSHPDISAVDYVVGATAERLDGDLLTRSAARFPMFPQLAPPY
jgi:predicted nucleic acid-binding protein